MEATERPSPDPRRVPTAAQAAAIAAPPGAVLVLAGPGAGKTLTLTRRAARLARLVDRARSVLCITFTNRAARELVSRLGAIAAERVIAGTFHAIAHRLIRPYAEFVDRSHDFSIYDGRASRKLVEGTLAPERHGLDAATACEAISLAKARLETPARMAERDRPLAAIWSEYERLLRESDALDFDDLIGRAVALLELPSVGERIAARFGAVLVDEYQDTNPAQYRLVELLAAAHRNITVIADDDQAIYGFRSADVRNLAHLEQGFPELERFVLGENHRSARPIVDAAASLIAHNRDRRSKELSAARTGPPVQVVALENEHAEAHVAASWCARLVEVGTPPSEIAVLYRTRDQARLLEEAFLSKRVPHHVLGSLGFFERAEVRDALAHLALVVNPNDRVALSRSAAAQPGIGPVAVARVGGYATDAQIDLIEACRQAAEVAGLKRKQAETLTRFGYALGECAAGADRVGVADTVIAVVMASGIPGRLRGERERLERLRQLIRSARSYEATADSPTLVEFIGHATLTANEGEGPDGRVTLSTIHAAKGLEWEHVRVVGMEEGLMPHRRAVTSAEIEEERRLAYVAMTRAKDELVLSRTRSRRGGPVVPSRFIAEALGLEERTDLRPARGRR